MLRSTFSAPALLVLGLFAPSLHAAEAKLANLDYSGSQAAVESLDKDLSAAGSNPAKLAALEQSLLKSLRAPDTTYAARQAICQRLGWVLALGQSKLTASDLKPLGTMLADERDSDLARLALEPATGAEIDALFVAALGKTTARTRLALIDSIARRRIAAAVPALAKLLGDTDTVTAAAAAKALGLIGDSAAATVLQAIREPSSAAVAAAKLSLATKLAAAPALALLADLRANAADPVVRSAALRLTLELEPSSTAIIAVLDGNDWTMKQVALESIYTSKAADVIAALSAKLTQWDVPTQSAVITAFARRGDATATPAVVVAATHADATVRAAAIEALGILPGTRDTATLLAKLATGTDSAEVKLAKASLARLNGPDVSALVLAGAETGAVATRIVLIEQLALRGAKESLPLLQKLRADPDAGVRAAAASAFGELAPTTEVKTLLDWTIAATDANEQSRALRALVTLALRDPAVAKRGVALYAAIESATPELALRLLPALGRIGGAPSAECAAKLAVRDDVKLAEAATAALARWTDNTALAALATVAEKTTVVPVRKSASAAVIASFERTRNTWIASDTTLISRLLAVTQTPEHRASLVALLNRASDAPALALAKKLSTDAAVGAAARETAEVIRANQAGPATARASTSAGASNLLDGKTNNRWTTPAEGDEWVEIDFKAVRPLHRITLDQTGRAEEFPEKYEVHVTNDPASPGPVVVAGTGQRNKTVINLPANTRGRYVIIKNVASRQDVPWAICEIFVD
jgi:hypothetical protein